MTPSLRRRIERLEAEQEAAGLAVSRKVAGLSDPQVCAVCATHWLADGFPETPPELLKRILDMCADPERHFRLYVDAFLKVCRGLTFRERRLRGWPEPDDWERLLEEDRADWLAWQRYAVAQWRAAQGEAQNERLAGDDYYR